MYKVGGPVSQGGLYSDEVDGPHGLGEDEEGEGEAEGEGAGQPLQAT